VNRATQALAALLSAGVALAAATAVEARTSNVVSYPVADVWPTAIRFLRVDRDYVIKEKDETAAYVIFEATENKRAYRGTLELVATSDGEGRPSTQIVVTLADLPRHFEVALVDKLAAKLRDERGLPAAPPPKRPPPAPAPPENPAQKPPTAEPGALPKPPVWGPEVR
jgi:hypothetical protein